MDDIQVIPAAKLDSDSDSVASGSAPDSPDLELLKSLALIGEQLAQTYSEANQETAEGFVLAMESMTNIQDRLATGQVLPGLSLREQDGLRELLSYLRKKIERRANAIKGNKVNY